MDNVTCVFLALCDWLYQWQSFPYFLPFLGHKSLIFMSIICKNIFMSGLCTNLPDWALIPLSDSIYGRSSTVPVFFIICVWVCDMVIYLHWLCTFYMFYIVWHLSIYVSITCWLCSHLLPVTSTQIAWCILLHLHIISEYVICRLHTTSVFYLLFCMQCWVVIYAVLHVA